MIISPDELDALSEIVNIGTGRAAASLSDLLGSRIELRVPAVEIVRRENISTSRETSFSIQQSFEGEVCGNALLSFPEESGDKLARLLGGYPADEELPAIELSGILSEVGNIVLNGVLGSLANLISTNLTYSVPDFFIEKHLATLIGERKTTEQSSILIADTHFRVASSNINGSVIIAFELGSFESLLEKMNGLIA